MLDYPEYKVEDGCSWRMS